LHEAVLSDAISRASTHRVEKYFTVVIMPPDLVFGFRRSIRLTCVVRRLQKDAASFVPCGQ
jgi:hypothetical protein